VTWPKAALLTCSSSSRTGPVEGLISLAHELRGQGVDARFAGDTVRPGEDLGGHLAHAGVPWETQLRLSRKVRMGDVLSDARLLKQWIREGRYDVLHTAFAHDHHLALWARSGEALVVRAAQRRQDLEPGAVGQRLYALKASDGVVVHAASYRDRLIQLGVHPSRIAVIAAGVDPVWFSPGKAPALRDTWGVPRDAFLFGMVARMKPERAHRVVLDAFARLPGDSWLVLVGRGEDEEELRKLAPPRVVFGGYQRGPALVEAYRALDAAIWLREGNDGACRGVLEAMACGVPVVAGNTGAPAELVRDGQDGFVASDADLVDALSAVRYRASTLGESARKRALEFTPARAAADTLAFWRRLRDLT
jgi:glycosyltransferase involved in cell wall biosynthesis